MSEMSDSELFNRVAATSFLVDAMESWRSIAQDENAPEHVRVEAALFARAIRGEADLPSGSGT